MGLRKLIFRYPASFSEMARLFVVQEKPDYNILEEKKMFQKKLVEKRSKELKSY